MACGTGAAEKPLCGDSSPEGPVNVEAKASPETETAAETFCKPLNLEPRTCYKRSPESSKPSKPTPSGGSRSPYVESQRKHTHIAAR